MSELVCFLMKNSCFGHILPPPTSRTHPYQSEKEAERVGKYMIRPLLSLARLSFDEQTGQVSYRYGKEDKEMELMDYLEFVARIISHIPDKGLPGSIGPTNFIALKASLRFLIPQAPPLAGFDISRATFHFL